MKRLTMAVALLGALALPGFAEEPGDDPDHGVARISLLSGDVTVRRGDSGEEIAAELNAPLVTRDHVFTNRGSRAEIQFDWATTLRMAPESEVRLSELADRDYRIQLAEGMITFRVLRDTDADIEISTPTASIHPKDKGIYRIEVRPDFSTEITVRSGKADVFVGSDFSPLRSGQTLVVRGDPSNPERNFVATIPQDDWDRWNESRDRDFERSDSYKYVSRDIHGADDLYGHGRWVYDSPYGWVWVPTVAASWAPYRDGRWYWADYYGWTWVSSDPWGWAPYHYGRWYQAPRYGWVWYPGAVGPRHYWRPALVSFFGWGVNVGNVSIGFGFGNLGWVPLAPYEVYRPWYGRNVTVVNVINRVNVIDTYRNARFVDGRNGVTSVVAGDFGRRRISDRDFVRADDRDLRGVGDVRGRVPLEPTREARRVSDRQPVARGNSRPDNNRTFVSRPDREPRDTTPQVRTEPRQEPRTEVRVRPAQPSQPTQAAQPERPSRPERQNPPERRAESFNAPAVDMPLRRQEVRIREPEAQSAQPSSPTQPTQPGRPSRPERQSPPNRPAESFARTTTSTDPPLRRQEVRIQEPQATPPQNDRSFERRSQREEPAARAVSPERAQVQSRQAQPGPGNPKGAERRAPQGQSSAPSNSGRKNRGF